MVVLALVGTWYTTGYIQWWGEDAGSRIEMQQLEEYYDAVIEDNDKLIEAYKNDTYGGDTPEETMDMFIEALKAGDLELASKYYVVELQGEARKDLEESLPLDMYIDILGWGSIGSLIGGNKRYRIDYYKDGKQMHVERLFLNKYTNKWKISKL